jgi:hypothetical protein
LKFLHFFSPEQPEANRRGPPLRHAEPKAKHPSAKAEERKAEDWKMDPSLRSE